MRHGIEHRLLRSMGKPLAALLVLALAPFAPARATADSSAASGDGPPQVLATDPDGSPLRILAAAADPETRGLWVVLENRSDRTFAQVTIEGRSSRLGVRAGGLMFTVPVLLPAGGRAEILRTIDTDLLARSDALVLSPREAVALDPGLGGTWRSEPAGRPPDLASARPLAGYRPASAEESTGAWPAEINGCCTDCRDSAELCGSNVLRTGCRGACVQSYSCSYALDDQGRCTDVDCSFACKGVESCC